MKNKEKIKSEDEEAVLSVDKFLEVIGEQERQKCEADFKKKLEKLSHNSCIKCGFVECAICWKDVEKLFSEDLKQKLKKYKSCTAPRGQFCSKHQVVHKEDVKDEN